jgi:HAD superfamily hydrolase (TIGR01484 family)
MSSSKKEIVEVSKYITNKEIKQENQVGEFINENIIKNKSKFFSIDLDGTLLNKDLSIDDETISSIKKAAALGHSIFVNTGRPLSEAISFYSKLGLENQKYISACNGAVLYSLEKKDYIYSITISRSEVISIFETSLKNNHRFIFYLFSADSSQYKVDSMDIKDLEKLDLGSINKIIIKSESISPDLETLFQVSHMEPDFYEITAKDVSKASSCKKVAELENLTSLNFVSIGDSLNDLSHIKWAHSS